MPANPILICAPTEQLKQNIEQALASSGYATTAVGTPAEAVAVIRDRDVDLIVAEGLAVSGAIASLRTAGRNGATPVLVVAPAPDLEARIAFLEAGADDVIASRFSPSELEGRVMALLIRYGRVRPEAGSGAAHAELISFFSPKGGVGTTTLAVNSAILLAGGGGPAPHGAAEPAVIAPGSRVLLVDLDLQFGQVATHLNLTPRFDLAGLAQDEPALNDPDLATTYLTRHSSGIAVLAAPANPEADFRVSLEQLQRIVELFRPAFDQIVVDLGSRLDPRTLWVLEQSDTHVLVVFPEIAALRATSLLLAFLSATTPLQARTHFVVNHVFPKELLKSRDVESLLKTKPAAEVPYTEVEMIRSVNEGVPVVVSRPTSPASAALRRVAQTIIGVEAAQPTRARPERRGLFRRRSPSTR